MAKCNANLLGVMIVYCDGNGNRIEKWVDLDAVEALSWCNADVGAKKKGNEKNGKLPVATEPPGPCPSTRGTVKEDPICWWNGSEWVCGTETA